ncbi:chorismate-binding protein [Janibacter alkaliphilus]|uniref:isochorismate synthase n=1 Tax=Janibacter alkaliphilus TaxID=1069963 RepID=A0A852X6N5_9MICO|nr:isochorismate synthase [Janibacter alkaliphilus]NYG37090.1 menaquinone-specific isochorismate synthase [Janibacter alkaliphilus]
MTSPSPAAPSPLIARTTAVPAARVGDLLDVLPPTADPAAVVSWVRRGEGLVGWGRVASVSTSGPDRFADAARWWRETTRECIVRDDVDLPGTGPVAFGTMTYSGSSQEESTLVVPEVLVGRRGRQAWVTTMTVDATVPPADVVPGRRTPPPAPGPVQIGDGRLDATSWAAAVEEAVARINAGALDKVVLARSVQARAEAPVDPRWLLRRLAEGYETTWVFAVDGMVGATPEMLVRLERGLVTSRVLAGTIRRSGDDSHDLALAASLARSSKDLEEHEYAVRSVADALAAHTSSVNVPESPFVLHLSNVMHLATDVAGVVDDDSTSLALASSLHPSAAVCGTPTPAADALISELEHLDRGRYAGPVGWMDASGDGEWGIALRSGRYQAPDRLRLYAGCGIVAGSRADEEVAESEAKLLPMRQALGG